jgi:hypothetical protein
MTVLENSAGDAVTGCVGDPASVLGNEPVDDLATGCQNPKRPDLIPLHQTRVARHIGGGILGTRASSRIYLHA